MKTITCDRCGEIIDNADTENRIVFNHKIQKFLEHMGKDYCVECKEILAHQIEDVLDEKDLYNPCNKCYWCYESSPFKDAHKCEEKVQGREQQRYPMCESQPAQIDCRVTNCFYYRGSGKCKNKAPAITLNPDKIFVCWSKDEEK